MLLVSRAYKKTSYEQFCGQHFACEKKSHKDRPCFNLLLSYRLFKKRRWWKFNEGGQKIINLSSKIFSCQFCFSPTCYEFYNFTSSKKKTAKINIKNSYTRERAGAVKFWRILNRKQNRETKQHLYHIASQPEKHRNLTVRRPGDTVQIQDCIYTTEGAT
jgi:hypothetical protein